jgi:hypothetical protein
LIFPGSGVAFDELGVSVKLCQSKAQTIEHSVPCRVKTGHGRTKLLCNAITLGNVKV